MDSRVGVSEDAPNVHLAHSCVHYRETHLRGTQSNQHQYAPRLSGLYGEEINQDKLQYQDMSQGTFKPSESGSGTEIFRDVFVFLLRLQSV